MRLFALVLKWLGLFTFAFGILGSLWAAVMFVQVETGWGLTPVEQCCASYGQSALALVLSSMFFVLSGAGLLLITRPLVARLAGGADRKPRWLLVIALFLVAYGLASIVLATMIAGNTDDFEGSGVGIVSYCMLAGVGCFVAAWGMRRAARA